MRYHIRDGQLPPLLQLVPGLANEAKGNLRIFGVHGPEDFTKKGREHKTTAGRVLSDRRDGGFLETGNLELDVEKRALPISS